ncbi:MAG: nucleotidyltransferase family protein [Acidobacteria bacterium]|nr:MAG: nucleotidyltransferase family protein [Acidobacteriota bacterium]
MIASIILAAGSSTRMGYPKALLSLHGVAFLELILRAHRTLGLPVYVVLGSHHEQIRASVDLSEATVLINERPELGQLSSLKLGLESTKDYAGVFVHPVDHPLVRRETLQLILDAQSESPSYILVPGYEDRRGHPVFFPRDFFRELLDAPLDQVARYVVSRHPESVTIVPVSDPGVLQNIDTPEDYKRVIGSKT